MPRGDMYRGSSMLGMGKHERKRERVEIWREEISQGRVRGKNRETEGEGAARANKCLFIC